MVGCRSEEVAFTMYDDLGLGIKDLGIWTRDAVGFTMDN